MLATRRPTQTRLVLVSSGEVPSGGAELLDLQNVMRAQALKYIAGKFSQFDPSAVENVFETADGAITSAELVFEHGNLWGVRFTEPDAEKAGRSWTVEISLGVADGRLLFGCRLSCFSRDYDFSFSPAVPAVLREFIKTYRLADYGFMLSSAAATIDGTEDVDGLEALIRSQTRWRNVVVASCDESLATLIDVERLASRLAGVAHVARITPKASYELSRRLGAPLSVYDMGVRTFRPSFSDVDDWSRHPLLLRRHLRQLDWSGQQAVEAGLSYDACRASIEREGLSTNVPSLADIRGASARARLLALRDSSLEDQIAAERNARSAAQSQADEALALAAQEDEQRRAMELERDNYKAQLFALRARMEGLEQRASDGLFVESQSRPTAYRDFAGWVQANFAGKLVLHPRAARAVKDAAYEDIGALCDAVQLLATTYRQVLLGHIDRAVVDKDLADLGMSMSGSISEERAAEEGEKYFVKWGNRRCFLHGHIAKGNSREERYCLRIYFFWNEAEEMIIVGWLPSHLPNQLT